MRRYERINGTNDYLGADAANLIRIANICSDTFNRYGYERLVLPILERSDIFLQRSGEEIRRRMYIFQDPGGKEVCLRPEMTISVAQAYLDNLSARRLPLRLSYQGDVFRYDKVREGRYRQFLQAGVENIGSKNRIAADVETISLALETIRNLGISNLSLLLGDLDLTTEFINSLPVSVTLRTRLLENFWRREAFELLLERFSQQSTSQSENNNAGAAQLADMLTSLGEDASHLLVRQILSLFVEKDIGTRNLDEITDRFLHRFLKSDAMSLPRECFEALNEYLSIVGPPREAMQQLERLLEKIGTSPGPAFQAMQRRIEVLERLEVAPQDVQLNLGFRRGIEYYTGLIFEIHSSALARQISQICGGGRYDRLLSALGAHTQIPAVGFAVGIDRLLLAIEAEKGDSDSSQIADVDAVLVTVGRVAEETALKLAQVCRQAGWRVRAQFDAKRLSDALSVASEERTPFVIIAGEDELRDHCVKIRDMFNRQEEVVAINDLAQFIRGKR